MNEAASPPAPPALQPPHVSTGSVAFGPQGELVWSPDPAETYVAATKVENAVVRQLTQAEAAALDPPVTLEARKATKLAELQAAADVAAQTSYAFDFAQAPTALDDGAAGAAADVKHLQMRPDDQDNWRAVFPLALGAQLTGATDPFPIRVEENLTVLASAGQVVDALKAVFVRNSGYIVGVLPALKHALAVAPDADAVAAIAWPDA